MQYTLDQVQNLKQALEKQIEQGLTQIVDAFSEETGLAVTAIRVDMMDLSTLSQVRSIPTKVRVQLKANNQLTIDGGPNDKEETDQG